MPIYRIRFRVLSEEIRAIPAATIDEALGAEPRAEELESSRVVRKERHVLEILPDSRQPNLFEDP